ncbi:hypothetical protein [Desertivirga arenae]|uniref:hypothetical protein n=1 Tax=Desertivirga arenae TaxID=2810309 RepID=UPI001A957831|nr:hypothetical protein [Pedobacter sp. SYSU D00823]
MKRHLLCGLLLIAGLNIPAKAQLTYPATSPGKPIVKISDKTLSLGNAALNIQFRLTGNRLDLSRFEDKGRGESLTLNTSLFQLTLDNSKILSSNSFVLKGKVRQADVNSNIQSTAYAASLNGKKLIAEMEEPQTGIKVVWEAMLTNNANYVRQKITLSTPTQASIKDIQMLKLPVAIGVKKVGTVDGSPLVHNNMFFALEHPMSQVNQTRSSIAASLPRLNPLVKGQTITVSSVLGVVPTGQLRRGFLYYVERERAQPYRQKLHYNSWFDISYATLKLNDSVCLDRIKMFGDSLVQKRKVKLNAYLFDDGWDDNRTLWQFNSGFPAGFKNVKNLAQKYGAGIGVWVSPWGGYDEPKQQRLDYGKKQSPPFETNANGFSLSGPVYRTRFKSVTDMFIKDYSVEMFKFDGVGAGNGASGASISFQSDIEALLTLITDMRSVKPDLYFSLTVGTWPSVYWLNYGDAIWRAGDDTGVSGTGTKRQQWMTYRDAQVFKNVVKRAPLYPLNSLMNHGICIADHGLPGTLELDDKNIEDEIWSFFGTGTSLQELYVNPHKLNTRTWDCLRDAASWSVAHKDILRDVHWVGGDPDKGDIYGFAGWDNNRGVLTLRNPSSVRKEYKLNVQEAFELPTGLESEYSFYNARAEKADKVYSGKVITIVLEPYEVKVLDGKKN